MATRNSVPFESGLQHVPLLGRAPDQSLELERQRLRDSRHVLAQTSLSLRRNRRRDDGEVVAARTGVTRRRDQRRARAQRQRCRTGWQADSFAEELNLDAVALDVTVTEQSNDAAVFQRLEQHRAGVLVEWLDADPDRL